MMFQREKKIVLEKPRERVYYAVAVQQLLCQRVRCDNLVASV